MNPPLAPAPIPAYLGIDGGGTHTRAWLVNAQGDLIGTGAAGPCNPSNVGVMASIANITTAGRAACTAAGVSVAAVRTAFVACAGIKTEAEGDALARQLDSAGLAVRVSVRNDTEAALAGGLAGDAGIALIAGTGSFCLGRDATRRTARCGGWGWLLDDAGSAFWLGREVVRAVALAADGRAPATLLHDPVLAHFGVDAADALLGVLYRPDRSPVSLADLAPFATTAARRGDAVALALLQVCARESATLVRHVAAALSWAGPVPVVVVGGLGRSGPPYTPLLQEAIRVAVPAAQLVEPRLPPVAGAALRALELAGVSRTAPLIQHLEASLSHDATA